MDHCGRRYLIALVAAIVLFVTPVVPLSSRTVFAADHSLVVTTTAVPDPATCPGGGGLSFTCAIVQANALPAGDTATITFNIPTGSCNAGTGACVIAPTSFALPQVTHAGITVDGFGQPNATGGAAAHVNTQTVSQPSDGLVLVQIDGASDTHDHSGLDWAGANGTIEGLSLTHWNYNTFSVKVGNGIVVEPAATGMTIKGDYIGVTPDRKGAYNHIAGIKILQGGSDTIGGTTPDAQNVVSANGYGIGICGASRVTVEGNRIGTTPDGDARLSDPVISTTISNFFGVQVDAYGNSCSGAGFTTTSTGITIGGTTAAARNLVSGNDFGIEAFSAVTIQGNFVGTDRAGSVKIGNRSGGLYLVGGQMVLGGSAPGAGNVISGNNEGAELLNPTGSVIAGNFIGTDATGTAALPNANTGIGFGIPGNGISLQGFGAAATNVTLGPGNLISGNVGDGVYWCNVSSGHVVGNLMGTNAAGTSALSNSGNDLFITNHCPNGVLGNSTNNTIGGTTVADRNIFSGSVSNFVGVHISPTTGSVSGTVIEGNFIGTNSAGTAAIANTVGVALDDNGGTVTGVTVGGTAPGAGNVISGNQNSGVLLSPFSGSDGLTHDNTIAGNLIGTKSDGATPLPNTQGILIRNGSASNTVGGASGTGAGNVIAGNNGPGVALSGSGSGNIIKGNWIGTNANGTAVPNQNSGVLINGNSIGETVGATDSTNVIANNTASGVFVGNAVNDHSQVVITRNSIHDNATDGITLSRSGSAKCSGPVAGAPDDYTPCPSPASASVQGVSGTACTGCTVEVFKADTLGEGKTWLGSATASGTCASPPCGGSASWSLLKTSCAGSTCTFPSGATLSPGDMVTTTATQSGSKPETSEFSSPIPVSAPTAARLIRFSATRMRVDRHSSILLCRWRVSSNRGIAGFDLLVAGRRLNSHLIPAHAGTAYHATVRTRLVGPVHLRIVMLGGAAPTVFSR